VSISAYLASIVSALAFSGMFSLNAAKALSSMAMMQSKAWIVMRALRRSPVQGSST